jgi:glycosyltransferase involved in cell wall biosynthesis
MSTSTPEFSILIPTRNRQLSARLTLRTVLETAGPNAEVIVADNSDVPLELGIDDGRVRLLRSNTVLSMPDNWERAVTAARGEWIILLSDKCRLVPGALEELRDLAGTRYSAVTYYRTSFVQDLRGGETTREEMWISRPGILSKPSRPFYAAPIASEVALRAWFDDIIYTGRPPMLYNALVNRRIIDGCLKRYPSLFVGMAPDVASSLSILTQVDEYLESHIPATTIHFPTNSRSEWSNGFSLKSGTGGAKGFISEFGASPFDRYLLPPIGTAVVMQTLLEFKRLRGASLPPDLRIGWTNFARSAAYEIEQYPADDRARLHLRLWRALHREGRNVSAAIAQFKAIVSARLPSLYGLYTRARSVRSSEPIPKSEQAEVVDVPVLSMDDALNRLALDIVRSRSSHT